MVRPVEYTSGCAREKAADKSRSWMPKKTMGNPRMKLKPGGEGGIGDASGVENGGGLVLFNEWVSISVEWVCTGCGEGVIGV